ncbi:uncharacterized protein LOC143914041 [Arctopsyche grandis]|uniref:uncharacterized protein LOC143914041 n=1 Tax=Arctopsyche grandis TaxID=121162 RepID=UPI00406D847E
MKLDVGLLVLLIRFLSLSSPCQGETGNCEYNNSCTNKDIGANGVSFVLPNQSNLGEIETKCPNVKSSGVLLSRRRRALSFPEGSNFVITISLVKALLIGIPLGWNIALENDVLFKSPGLRELLRYKHPRLGLHHKQRRELWRGIEGAFEVHGFNGESCVLRALCEVKYLLAPKDASFIEDIVRILLFVPENGGPNDRYKKASKVEDCNEYNGEKKCPFSPLELLLSSARVI